MSIATVISMTAAFLAGCGGSEEDQVAEAAREYFVAFTDGDGGAACERLSAEARLTLSALAPPPELPSCAEVMETARDFLTDEERASYREAAQEIQGDLVQIQGDTATIAPAGGAFDLHLEEDAGEWKISAKTLRDGLRSLGRAEGVAAPEERGDEDDAVAPDATAGLADLEERLTGAGYDVDGPFDPPDPEVDAGLVVQRDIDVLLWGSKAARDKYVGRLEGLKRSRGGRVMFAVQGQVTFYLAQEQALTPKEIADFEGVVAVARGG